MRSLLLLLVCVLSVPLAAHGQRAPVRLSAISYLDYGYQIASPDSSQEGEDGFLLRRINVRMDGQLSERFSAHIRVEANAQSVPELFVHSAWMRWHDVFGAEQDLMLGLFPNPAIGRRDDAWGYRHLERVLIDRLAVVDSRDLGIGFQGTAAPFTYTLALVNGQERWRGEQGREVYAVLEATPGPFSFAGGASYRQAEGEDFHEVNVLGAWNRENHRLGAEAFAEGGALTRQGASLFGTLGLTPRWTVIGRIEGVWYDERTEYFSIGGIGYRVGPELEIVPNVVVAWEEGEQANVLARATLFLRF